MRRFKPWSIAVFAALVIAALSISVAADENAAEELTSAVTLELSFEENAGDVLDGSEYSYITVPAGGTITVSGGNVGGIYVKFHLRSHEWLLSADGRYFNLGQNGFLHEWVSLDGAAGTLVMTFPEETQICEIRIFGVGTPPPDVQVWQPQYDKADALLLSSHSDDEQLFFAGLIPYCAANDIDLQVVYFCYHDDTPIRLHEQLNGLWTAGATHYPEIGRFPDLYSESIEGAQSVFAARGYEYDDFVAYQCEIIRRYKPEVLVAHDVNGEYGHGTHRLNTAAARDALELSADASVYPDSAEKYGTWDVPKTYIHLWGERQIVMDYDTPLDFFGGRTAYQMSVEGYGCHNSQHWTWFTRWLLGTDEAPITAASQIGKYSPCEFGLYRTTVGDDEAGDMFEHVTLRRDIPPETQPPETTPPETTVASTEDTSDTASTSSAPNRTTPPKSSIYVVFIAIAAAFVIAVIAIALVNMSDNSRRRHAKRRRRR